MLIFKSEHLEHGFVDFAPSICVPKDQNYTFWAKKYRRTDRRTDRHDSHIFILDPVCISRTQYRGDRVNNPPKLIETAQDLFENLES